MGPTALSQSEFEIRLWAFTGRLRGVDLLYTDGWLSMSKPSTSGGSTNFSAAATVKLAQLPRALRTGGLSSLAFVLWSRDGAERSALAPAGDHMHVDAGLASESQHALHHRGAARDLLPSGPARRP